MSSATVGPAHGPFAAARVRQWPAALVFALIVAWLVATAWARPLMLPDEGRYASVALDMVHSGDWLTPRLDGLPFFHKPPLFYWITGAALQVFGTHELAARTASLLGASAVAFALYLFTRRRVGPGAALATLAALLTNPMFFVGAQFANLDMLVGGCIGVTVLLFAEAASRQDAGEPGAPGLLAAAFGMAALGVLAKGLIGALLPALVIIVWRASLGRWRGILSLWSWPGTLLFVAVAAPWFIAMQARFPEFLHYFIVVQHLQRFASTGFNNVQPVWFYPAVLALFALPWLAALAWRRRAPAGDAVTPDASPEPMAAWRRLMWCWLVAIVGFFSLPQSKLIGYVLPALPPLAALIGVAAAAAWAARPRRRAIVAGGVLSALVGLVAVTALATGGHQSQRPIGTALAALRAPAEPVFFVEDYFYDAGFYAGLRTPTPVFMDWQAADLAQHDNARKELFDAAEFDPALAPAVLRQPDELPRTLCDAGVAWMVLPTASTASYAFLAGQRPVAEAGRASLWRIDAHRPATAQALGCAAR